MSGYGDGRTPSDPEPTGAQAQGPDFAPHDFAPPGADDTHVLPTAGRPAPESTVAMPRPVAPPCSRPPRTRRRPHPASPGPGP